MRRRISATAGGDAPRAGATTSHAHNHPGAIPIEAAAQRILPDTVATMLDLGAEPAKALTALLTWWVGNVRWAGYRKGEVVNVIELLRTGGAAVTARDRELASEAGASEVVAALDV